MNKEEIKMSKRTMEEFKKLTRPLMRFLNEKYNPHCKIIIENNGAELVSGEIAVYTKDFIKD